MTPFLLKLCSASLLGCGILYSDVPGPQFWRAWSEIRADKTTGDLVASSTTQFYYSGTGFASAFARMTLSGGGINFVKEEVDNCGATCAQALVYTSVTMLGATYSVSGSHEGMAIPLDLPSWYKYDYSDTFIKIPMAPSTTFSGIYNSDPNFPSFRFGFLGTEPSYAVLQVGQATGIGSPSNNEVSLPIDLSQIPVGYNAVNLTIGMYGLASPATAICSIERSGHQPYSASSTQLILVGGEIVAPHFVPFTHEATDVIEVFTYCQAPFPSYPIRAIASLGSVSCPDHSVDYIFLTSEEHTFLPAYYYASLPVVWDGWPPNSKWRVNHRSSYTNTWLTNGSSGRTCNHSVNIKVSDGSVQAALGCLSFQFP